MFLAHMTQVQNCAATQNHMLRRRVILEKKKKEKHKLRKKSSGKTFELTQFVIVAISYEENF